MLIAELNIEKIQYSHFAAIVKGNSHESMKFSKGAKLYLYENVKHRTVKVLSLEMQEFRRILTTA